MISPVFLSLNRLILAHLFLPFNYAGQQIHRLFSHIFLHYFKKIADLGKHFQPIHFVLE